MQCLVCDEMHPWRQLAARYPPPSPSPRWEAVTQSWKRALPYHIACENDNYWWYPSDFLTYHIWDEILLFKKKPITNENKKAELDQVIQFYLYEVTSYIKSE